MEAVRRLENTNHAYYGREHSDDMITNMNNLNTNLCRTNFNTASDTPAFNTPFTQNAYQVPSPRNFFGIAHASGHSRPTQINYQFPNTYKGKNPFPPLLGPKQFTMFGA